MGENGEGLRGDGHVAVLERLWGEEYRSPCGAEEAGRVIEGLDLAGATVVDIGCGRAGGSPPRTG